MSGPSPYTIEMAMSVAEATLARLRDAGEIDIETDETALLALLGEPGIEITHLLERIVSAALEAESHSIAAANRINALTGRKRRFDRMAETWRGTALAMMDALGMKRHIGGEFTVTLAGGLPQVVITEEALLPEEYIVVTRVPSLKAIRADLAEGVVIPGAEFTNGPPYLKVKKG
jgi:hypothetical protein